MNVLLSLLHSSPEYESLRTMLDTGQTAAVSKSDRSHVVL